MIAVIDYGMGNLYSIANALEKVGADAEITSSVSKIGRADGVLIPGVGSFGDGMRNLKPFIPNLLKFVESGKPVLGICLGLQMFFESSEEGSAEGLGIMKGEVKLLPETVRIPQMGWNSIKVLRQTPLFEGIKRGDFFFFAHSYHCVPSEKVSVAEVEYGKRITVAVKKGNVHGVQFHPEKSGEKGLMIMKNFANICKSEQPQSDLEL